MKNENIYQARQRRRNCHLEGWMPTAKQLKKLRHGLKFHRSAKMLRNDP